MQVWYNISTIFKRRYALRYAGLIALCIAFITTLLFNVTSHAAPGVNQTLSFQGRLLSSSGAVVPDGHYNMQFKIYQNGDGTKAGDTGGTGGELKWTESYVNANASAGVEIKNGFFSVNLGSLNPFGTQVDWNQDTLWLSMNIAGTAGDCTTFGSGTCAADGEMLPMRQITSTPFALNSGMVGGKTADELAQLGQGVQTDTSDNSSLFINKTGTGNLIQLQNTATDIFTITNAGDVTLGSNADHTISVGASAEDIDGMQLTLAAGAGGSGTGSAGGELVLSGGDGGGANANGGNITLSGGTGTGTGVSGLVIMGTPTFSTTTDDANCYASGALVALSCTIAESSVNGTSAILVGFSADNQTATLPDPTITTAGRIVYVLAADNSKDFTLSMNGGGAGNEIILQQNTATALIWNGADWLVASGSTALQGNKAVDGSIPNVQIGDGADNGVTTLLTLDHAAAAPSVTDDQALLGSMYYDTTLGELQCYETDGWGSCSAAPDTFITLSPTYSNAVMHGDDTGTMTVDLCSDGLGINDADDGTNICGTNETYNFYGWTSDQTTNQTRSIFVTYQLPTTFKEFVDSSTSLMGRTDSSDSSVTYQVYRNNGSSGLIACGSATSVSTGAQTTWQKATASSSADPSNCSFEAGDSIIFEIDLTAKNDANAYVSNLNFAFSND